jgi:hypothetical protein
MLIKTFPAERTADPDPLSQIIYPVAFNQNLNILYIGKFSGSPDNLL